MANYVAHLNSWFKQISLMKEEVRPSHISIYISLFSIWNINRFAHRIKITRSELMVASKVGGNNTYCKCMNDMVKWGWIEYRRPLARYEMSEVVMLPMPCLKAQKGEGKHSTSESTTSNTASSTERIPESKPKEYQFNKQYKQGKLGKQNLKNNKDYNEEI